MIEHKFTLDQFRSSHEKMIAKASEYWNRYYGTESVARYRDYTEKEIEDIVNSGSLIEQQKLSRNYFYKDGFYKRIILHYATLLTYSGLLIPNPAIGKKLSTPHISKRYYSALEYVDKMNLAEIMTRMSIRVLIDGAYYGIIQTLTRDKFVMFDLPTAYCRSRYVDVNGDDIIEFNVTYFNTIIDKTAREATLSSYPKVISSYYKSYGKGKQTTPWVTIPTEIGVFFSLFGNVPPFLQVIPATIRYDKAIERRENAELEEIKKIIVQKIPHLTDGTLLFEPEEAVEIHQGTVGMMKGNKNVSVLTTYADIDSIVSKTSAENDASTLDKMLQNVYADAGVSSQIFAPLGVQAIMLSIINDMTFMMVLANKYARFVTKVVNHLFSNANISFKYTILALSLFNKSDFIADSLKLAQSGYSYLLPAVAAGLSQREIVNIKDLENDVLGLRDKFIPLQTSYTESNGKVGAPEKKLEEKSEKTIKNEDAIDRQGQGGSA